MRLKYLVIFFVSLLAISLELFFTRILNLKTWNHVVYIIIPYAILGYGIGANIYLICKNYFKKWKEDYLIAYLLLLLSIFSIVSTQAIIDFPILIAYIAKLLVNIKAIYMLLISYTILMIPFVFIGFLVVFLFTTQPISNNKLYFWDLLGAGLGAFLFYPLINSMNVFHSILFLSLIIFYLSLLLFFPKHYWLFGPFVILCSAIAFTALPEPDRYTVDKTKGWEYIPGFVPAEYYERIVSRWHPLGRTEIFRITDEYVQERLYANAVGTFEINVRPIPEFSFVSTNYLAGTPIYKFSSEGLAEKNSKIYLFSEAMECPYVLEKEPKTLIIGTGGGRDIFMAETHGAKEIYGAEINPAIYAEMAPGGKFYEYSGKIYFHPNTKIFNEDGRHLVKRLDSQDFDLIILNGVDTFSGLSTGAYAYAESYLYTKEAVLDYLRTLKVNGIINFNRWSFYPDTPREELRLFAIALEALRTIGAQEPWEHIILGTYRFWAIFLIKKTPFTPEERETVENYFLEHNIKLIFPSTEQSSYISIFNQYVQSFKEKKEKMFAKNYPCDISVISDDAPFFYKYYKLNSFNPFNVFVKHHTGTIIFMTQVLVLVQAVVFILIFIFLPLYVFKKTEVKNMPTDFRNSFILFFSCLGCGYMFIEIPMMQRFVLLLGSPIYSISVTLTALLISSGLGSLLLPYAQKFLKSKKFCLTLSTALLAALILGLVSIGMKSLDHLIGLPFMGRVLIVCLILFPVGLLLGMFFPSGLQLISREYENAIPWAWGINSGFSVLGSILAIIFAQFWGFSTILQLALIIYVLALFAYRRMLNTSG